jgi:hypothetical protein
MTRPDTPGHRTGPDPTVAGEQVLPRLSRPPLVRRIPIRLAVTAARLVSHLPPRRIRAILSLLRHGAPAATYEQAAAARRDVVATSLYCAGRYCLPRSLAATLLCRLRGTWPTWCTGVRTAPFAAHAWIAVDDQPVDEPADTSTYRPLLRVPPSTTPD